MADETKPPFHSITFTMMENKRPQTTFRLANCDDGMYSLTVRKGPTANPISKVERKVPYETAVRLRDALQTIGVFGWDERYGDTHAPGALRWTLRTVFQEEVFSIESKGGSDVPQGFDQMLEELYRLDFPRPSTEGSPISQDGALARGISSGSGLSGARLDEGFRSAGSIAGAGGVGGMSVGDWSAYASTGAGGVDFSQLADLLKNGGLPNLGGSSLGDMLDEAQRNPQIIQQRMKEEFNHLPPDEQNQMLDALAATGLASRAWWERFFRS